MNNPIDLKELSDFLDAANKHTYANKNAPKTASSRLESEDYHFENGSLIYHDTYFGGRNFIGEEIVYKNRKPVWGLNYYGFILSEDATEDEVYDFLRKSLTQEYNDILPVRGPKFFTENEYKYSNEVSGKLDNFLGKEEIYLNNSVIYRAFYHGGFIL